MEQSKLLPLAGTNIDITHRSARNKQCMHRSQSDIPIGTVPQAHVSPIRCKQNGADICVNGNEYKGKKHIITQVAPEDFSLEDVKHLQKLVRELHVENIQKTLCNVRLEKAFHSLKDEVAHLKRAMSKRTETESGEKIYGEQKALLKQSDQMDKEKLIKELNMLQQNCEAMRAEETRLRGLVNVYEEKFHYFNGIVKDSNALLAENKEVLNNMTRRIQFLESEIAMWKERSEEYEKLLMEMSSKVQTDVYAQVDLPSPTVIYNGSPRSETFAVANFQSPMQRATQTDQNDANTSVYSKFLAPKVNSCFSCVKAALCHCPAVPTRRTNVPKRVDEKL